MAEENKPPENAPGLPQERMEIKITQSHADMAARAIKEFKEAGTPWDGYVTMAMMMVYLEVVLQIASKASVSNLLSAYTVIQKNQGLKEQIVADISTQILEKKIIVPATRH